MTTTNVSRHRLEGNIAPGGGPQCEFPSIPPEAFLGADKEIDIWPQNQPEKLMSYVPQAPSGLFSVALDAYCRFQKAVLDEAFFSDLRSPVAKPILPEASPALPEQGGASVGWPATLGCTPFSVQAGESQWRADFPAACFGSSGLGMAPTVLGTPRWWACCSNSVFSLSLHPHPTLPSAICMTKSSRPSKDCPGRVRTPVGFSSPSVGSRNPAPSSCESPQGCGASPPAPHPCSKCNDRLPPLPGPQPAGFLSC